MKTLTLLTILITPIVAISQGINFEKDFFSNGYSALQNLKVVGDFSYVLSYENQINTPSYQLKKIDTTGNVLWEEHVMKYSPTYSVLVNIDTVIVSGLGDNGCDVPGVPRNYMQKILPNGTTAWELIHNENEDWPIISMSNTAIKNAALGELAFSTTVDGITKVYTVNSNGTLSDSVEIETQDVEDIVFFSDGTFVCQANEGVYLYNSTGVLLNSIILTGFKEFHVVNDELVILSSDNLFKYNQTLGLVASWSDVSFTNLLSLDASLSEYSVLNFNGSSFEVLTFSTDLNSFTVQAYNDYIEDFDIVDISENQVFFGRSFDLTSHGSVRVVNYSREDAEDYISQRSDIGISNIVVTNSSLTPLYPGATAMWCYYDADVTITNYGTTPVSSAFVNKFNTNMVICGTDLYSEEFNFAPIGQFESVTVSVSLFEYGLGPNNQGEYVIENCVYTAQPNQQTDLIVPNDNYCLFETVGYLGVKEEGNTDISIAPNPVQNELNIHTDAEIKEIQLINSLGQVVLSSHLKTINVQELNVGVYFVNCFLENGEVVKGYKVVKQ